MSVVPWLDEVAKAISVPCSGAGNVGHAYGEASMVCGVCGESFRSENGVIPQHTRLWLDEDSQTLTALVIYSAERIGSERKLEDSEGDEYEPS